MKPSLEKLSQQWLEFKRLEQEANRKRLEIEQAIVEAAKEEIPAQGTTKIGCVKITTGFDRKWDTSILTEIYRTKPPVFPFNVDWKEDRRTSLKLEIERPDVMTIFVPALTIREKKPAFTFVDV